MLFRSGQEEVNVARGLVEGTGEKGRLSLIFAKFRKVERSYQGKKKQLE